MDVIKIQSKLFGKKAKNALEFTALVAAIIAAFPIIFPDNMQKLNRILCNNHEGPTEMFQIEDIKEEER